MRDDVINILAGQKDLTHVFIATFNIDFLFIENVLLRALRKCGHPSLTVFADADEVATTFVSQGRWVSRIGRRYRVVPIRMAPGFRFHPKVVMLAGADQATVLVGSGNLTFGGMRQNDEFWIRFDSSSDDTGPLSAFRELASQCLDKAPFPGPALAELADAFEPGGHSWSRSLDRPAGLLMRVGNGATLLSQIEAAVGDLVVRRIVVGSPYFDETGEALNAIAARWPNALLEAVVQPGQSQLLRSSWSRIREPKALVSVATSRSEDAQAFIHAKFYCFVGARDAVMFIGSANCSRAALMVPGAGGNAEALAVIRLSAEEGDAAIRAGLRTVETPVVLPAELPAPSPTGPATAIRVLGAHYEHSELVVLYEAPQQTQLIELVVDGRSLREPDITVTDGVLRVQSIGVVNRVAVVAHENGIRLCSPEHWVDHEFLLSASNRQRQMAQAIGDHVAPGQWSFQGWTEVLRLLGDHLVHSPERAPRESQQQQDNKQEPSSLEAAQFFTADYRLPNRRHGRGRLDETSRVLGLRGLLLDYFGIRNDEDEPGAQTIDDENDGDVVDTEETPKRKEQVDDRRKTKRDLTQAEVRRGNRIAKQIVDTCTSKPFIESRPAPMLSSDLAIVSVLLVSGHAERWLASGSFLDLTYRVWSFLFFDDGTDDGGPSTGALVRRHATSASPRRLEESMRSVRLAAALATWCFCCPQGITRAETARFEVATRLAIARCPWLWLLESRDQVERELFEIAQRTGWLGPDVGERWGRVLEGWNHLFAEGIALREFEQILVRIPMVTLRERLTDDDVPAGTLLWQGPKLGFCMLSEAAKRRMRPGQPVSVLTLRSKNRDTRLSPPYLLPFRSLLRLLAADASAPLTPANTETLGAFAERLESTWHLGR